MIQNKPSEFDKITVIAFDADVAPLNHKSSVYPQVDLVRALLRVTMPSDQDKIKWMYQLFGAWYFGDEKCPMPYIECQLMNVEFINTYNLSIFRGEKQYYVWCQFRAEHIEPKEEPAVLDKPLGYDEFYSSRGV